MTQIHMLLFFTKGGGRSEATLLVLIYGHMCSSELLGSQKIHSLLIPTG
jgi:hypothetical protein